MKKGKVFKRSGAPKKAELNNPDRGLTKEQIEQRYKLLAKFMLKVRAAKKDPVIFIDEFCYTFNPKQHPFHLPFKLFDFQKSYVRELQESIDVGKDLFVEKCREMGVTYTTLAVLLWYWFNVPGSNFLLGSRKEDYVDNRSGSKGEGSNKEESLFGKLDYIMSRLPDVMLPKGFNPKKHFTFMSLVNPENGNIISGESSNPNFSRGGRFKAIFLDEFAFWDESTSVWGSTADTSNSRIVVTTPGIAPGKAKRLRFGEDGENIKVVSLDYSLDPRKTQEWMMEQRKRRSSEDFAREIMINWEGSMKGNVYPEIALAEIGDYLYDTQLPLYCAWDFGLDGLAINFWQLNPSNGKPRLIDSYFNTNKPLDFYFPFFGFPIDSKFEYDQTDLDAIGAFKNFKKPIHFGDPDVEKRSLHTNISTRQVLQLKNIYIQTNTASNSFIVRREKTKILLQGGIEINNTPRNKYWLDCIKNARYPQRKEEAQGTSPISKPIHNWTSHHRTALEYFAVNYDPSIFNSFKKEETPEWVEKIPQWKKNYQKG
jgi:hypothetical protein